MESESNEVHFPKVPFETFPPLICILQPFLILLHNQCVVVRNSIKKIYSIYVNDMRCILMKLCDCLNLSNLKGINGWNSMNAYHILPYSSNKRLIYDGNEFSISNSDG